MAPEFIAAQIAQAIREKVFAPGAPLIQEDLAKRFNVSRNPVREALRMLAAEGLVTLIPGSGATVRKLSIEDLTELYDLRIALEPILAEAIVEEATRRVIAELRVLADTMDNTTDDTVWMRANFDFHACLYAIPERPHTEAILRSLLSSVQPYTHQNVIALGGRSKASEEHHLMIEAIAGGDGIRLAELMRDHLGSARARLRETYVAEPMANAFR